MGAEPAPIPITDRPNFLIILMDDMGFSDIGAYGGEAETPNIDRLAHDGLRFRQFYNAARCCPTRASLLTGLYPHQAGLGHMTHISPGEPKSYSKHLLPEVTTVAEVLRDAGYFTANTGKWHVNSTAEQWPIRRGFDHVYGSEIGGLYYYAQHSVYRDGKILYQPGDDLPDDFYSTDVWNEWTVKYIQQAHDQGKPFFIYLAHVAPHFPAQAPDDTIEKYRGRFMDGWEKLREVKLERQKEIGLFGTHVELSSWPGEVPRWDELTLEQRDRMDLFQSIYLATIDETDRGIGRILRKLEELGRLDNTVIFFLSDNGGNGESGWEGHVQEDMHKFGFDPGRVGRQGGAGIWPGKGWATLQNSPLRNYKHDIDEGGIRTPLVVHWPAGLGQDMRGQWTDAIGHVMDLSPTLLDLAGVPADQRPHQEGQSLLPAIRGEAISRDGSIFWEHESNAGVRDGNWKLVRGQGEGWALYNVNEDPVENHDLAGQQPKRAEAMAKRWQAWAGRVGVIPFRDIRRVTLEPPQQNKATEARTTPTAPSSVTEGLKLWLRADTIRGVDDGQPLGHWPDLATGFTPEDGAQDAGQAFANQPPWSGLEPRNFVELAAPIYVADDGAGRPAIRFDAQHRTGLSYFGGIGLAGGTSPDEAGQDSFTIFVAFRPSAETRGSRLFQLGDAEGIGEDGGPGTSVAICYEPSPGRVIAGARFQNGNRLITSSAHDETDDVQILAVRLEAGQMYKDSTVLLAELSEPANSVNPSAHTSLRNEGYNLGYGNNRAGKPINFFDGWIYEVRYYQRALSPEDMSTVQAEMTKNYN